MTRVIGFAGWSGSGKTTVLDKLIPELKSHGISVSTVKHAHHAFDIDHPGKDSYRHREAGATEVLVSSGRRWALMHELRDAAEPGLTELLEHLSPVDLVLVEGFKRDRHPKIEIHRLANGKPLLFPEDDAICAVVSDAPDLEPALPFAHLNDIAGICKLVLQLAQPLDHIKTLLSQDRLPSHKA